MITAELHAHVFMDGVDYRESVNRFKDGPDERAIRSVLRAYRDKGISFVRDGGDHFGACLLAKRIAGEYEITYSIPVYALFRDGNYGRVAGVPYRDLTEYRVLISEAASQGADFVKIMLSGILDFNQFGVVTETDYTLPFAKELVHIAHEEGFAVMAHASGTECVRMAALAGADTIEHGYYMNEETMDILAQKDLVWVPTAVTGFNLIGTGRFDEQEVKRIADAHLEAVAKAASKGVRIGCGSDAGAFSVLHGTGCLEEYALLKKTIGPDADRILEAAEKTVKAKFTK